jgi:Tol biopolymer transport system component/DNA-binding winged helix-turn-helix (wHTH) protein
MTSTANTQAPGPARFRVGAVLVDAGANELEGGGGVQRIEGRSMAVLVFLARHAGDVARREELMAEVWRGRIVTDDSLTRAIAQLRQALGDAAAIETIPKVGYRLKWPVTTVERAGDPADAASEVALADGAAVVSDAQANGSANGSANASTNGSTNASANGTAQAARTPWPAWLLIAAAAAALLWWLGRSSNGAPALPPLVIRSVTPVAAIPGVKRMPRFSRDGQQLVFDLQPDGAVDRDIWVVDLPTWSARQITRGAAIEQHADWTRDGTAIVYVRSEHGHCELVRKSLVTAVEHIIRECSFGTFVRPRVSPDGTSIVYSDLIENGTQAVLFETDLKSGEQRQLTHPDPGWFDLYPEYTPAGDKIVYGRATLAAVRDLYLYDRASGETHALHREPGIVTDATMESSEVYMFATQRTGQMQLIRRNLAGQEQALGLGADFIRGATLSHDRQRLAFESWTIRQRIVRASLGAAASTDVSVSSRIDRVPKLSPDGRRLAFISTRDGYANVWINEGGVERQLTHFRPEDPEFLSWHPTEPWLAFSITRADGSFACMVDTAVAAPELQCGEGSGRAAPFWSPDGQHFRFAAPDGKGYAVFETDSVRSKATPKRIIANAYFAQPLSSGGHCFQRAGRDGVWCDRGDGERLVMPEQGWFGHKNWVLDGDVVYALQLDGRLLTVEVDGHETRELGRLPGRMHVNSGLNRTVDGDFIYATLTTYESELMLADLASH